MKKIWSNLHFSVLCKPKWCMKLNLLVNKYCSQWDVIYKYAIIAGYEVCVELAEERESNYMQF